MSLSLFQPTVPAINSTDAGGTAGVNVGFTFSVNADGQVNGIYFYKAAANTGTHVVGLFTKGTLSPALATATVSGETASGWQYQAFSSPVSVTASTQYVAVVYMPAGHYSYTTSAFPANINRISAPADATGTPNGAFLYVTSSGIRYPTSSGANQWYGLDINYTTSANMTPPTANAGSGQTIDAGTTVTLDGTGSSAINPATIASYAWTQISGTTVTLSSKTVAKPTFTAPAFNGTLVFGLIVKDSDTLQSSQATVTITVQAVPTANAGSNQTIDLGLPAALDGTHSTAVNPATISSYAWTQISGTSVTLSSSSVAQPTFTTPNSPSTLVFGLTVTDSNGLTSSQATVTVTAEHCLSLAYPAIPTTNVTHAQDSGSYSLGFTFSADVNGQINGIYFYKAVTSTGTHAIGLFLQSDKSTIATATVVNETASGWQYQAFSSPVSVTAGTLYTAAAFMPSGYSVTANAFPATANHITAPADSGPTPNGLFLTALSIRYPTSSSANQSYGVDINFSTTNANMIAPIASAGTNQTVQDNVMVTLDGTGSTATNPATIASYAWTQISGTHVTLSSATAAKPTFTTPASSTVLVFGLTVTDSATLVSSQATVTITVQAVPTANAGSNQIANETSVVTLNGSGSTAVNPATISSYAWTQISGTSVTLSSSSAAQPTFTAPSSASTIVFGLTVIDSNGLTSSQAMVTITVGVIETGLSLLYPVTPTKIDSNDGSSLTVGLTFAVAFNGRIEGVRFYKASTNTGTHIGALYTSSGTLLAQVTFSGETASGWQYQAFSSPVSVTANTYYVAAVFMPVGHYSADESAFATSALTVHQITAPVSSDSTPNGVYVIGNSLAFPVLTFKATNYFVDINYTTLNAPPTADAGSDQTVNAYATVSLDGANSSAIGTVTGYSWRQISGTTTTLSSTSVVSPTFLAPPANGGTPNVLVFGLTVTDDQSQVSSEDQVTITVGSAGAFMLIAGQWTPRKRYALRGGSWQ